MTKPFRWDLDKNEQLTQERGVSFEQITVAVARVELLQVVQHPNSERYPGQRFMIVGLGGSSCLGQFVEQAE